MDGSYNAGRVAYRPAYDYQPDAGLALIGDSMETVLQYWPIVTGFVGFLVWLIRLEGRSVENTKEIKRLWNQRKEDLDASKEAREETNKMLSEIRDDIKALIARVGK
jgi:large-conductance mechanosensitive channel